ncbi:MAG: protoporphyrinogen oxidase [Desulfovibrio sp.]|nr:protoporphyrinogen oxidase [Desulfovibrio sp.]
MKRLLIFFPLLFLLWATVCVAGERNFLEFSVTLPDGWDGSERSAFISNDKREYMLVLGLKNEKEDAYRALISIYLLPNKPGKNAHDSAIALAEQQANASEPREEGPFWVFTGNPRDNILKGMAQTFVAANASDLFIIIVKDPEKIGATDIIRTLRPRTERSTALLPPAQGVTAN